MNKRNLLVSAAFIGLSVVGMTSCSSKIDQMLIGECHGVNSCKGTGDCGGKLHACAGKNSCKGKGWLKMSKGDCDSKSGQFVADSE